MSARPRDVLDLSGNTSLVALRHIAPQNGARILLKLESENPTGNMKDRMALAILHIVSSDAFAQEKLDHMRILGATLTVVPSEGGRQTRL
jgi:cysteine synthase